MAPNRSPSVMNQAAMSHRIHEYPISHDVNKLLSSMGTHGFLHFGGLFEPYIGGFLNLQISMGCWVARVGGLEDKDM